MKISASIKSPTPDIVEAAHEEMRKNNIAYKLHFDPDNHDVIWAPVIIDGMDTGYKISTYGDLINSRNLPIKPFVRDDGYVQYGLSVGGVEYTRKAHALVANAFLENDDPEHKTEVDHLDGVKTDNYFKALEWVSTEENIRRAWEKGLCDEGLIRRSGSGHGMVKYSESIIHEICKDLEKGINPVKIADRLSVPVSLVYSVQYGRWKIISSNYDICDENGNPKCSTRTLSSDEARQICEMLAAGTSPADIIKKMGVTHTIITAIKNRTTYQEISKDYDFEHADHNKNYRQISDEDAHTICQLYQSGKGPVSIHQLMPHISADLISSVVSPTSESYRDIRSQYDFSSTVVTKPRSLDNDQVHRICQMFEKRCSPTEISRTIGIPLSTVRNIKNGLAYRDISTQYTFPGNLKRENRKLDADTVHEICQRMQDGQPPHIISQSIGVPMKDIYNIKNGEAYRDISAGYTFPKNFTQEMKRLSDETVHQICSLLQDKKKPLEIAEITGVPVRDIYTIKSRIAYKNISSSYVFWRRDGVAV